MSGYKERDAARETRVSQRTVEATWHQARDDSAVRGGAADDRPTPENERDAKLLKERLEARGRKTEAREQKREH